MNKKRYFKDNKSYFNFISKYKDLYEIIKVDLIKNKFVVVYRPIFIGGKND